MTEEKETKSFEEIMTELDDIVHQLENKEIPLEQSVELYAKGLELSKIASSILKSQEKIVVEKMTENGVENFPNTLE